MGKDCRSGVDWGCGADLCTCVCFVGWFGGWGGRKVQEMDGRNNTNGNRIIVDILPQLQPLLRPIIPHNNKPNLAAVLPSLPPLPPPLPNPPNPIPLPANIPSPLPPHPTLPQDNNPVLPNNLRPSDPERHPSLGPVLPIIFMLWRDYRGSGQEAEGCVEGVDGYDGGCKWNDTGDLLEGCGLVADHSFCVCGVFCCPGTGVLGSACCVSLRGIDCTRKREIEGGER